MSDGQARVLAGRRETESQSARWIIEGYERILRSHVVINDGARVGEAERQIGELRHLLRQADQACETLKNLRTASAAAARHWDHRRAQWRPDSRGRRAYDRAA